MSQIYDSKNIVCLHCKTPFAKRMAMAFGHGGALHKGMIMVCSACGGAMILGDADWRPMTAFDFKALPPASQRALALVAQQLRVRLKAGVEWSPYDQPPPRRD